MNAARWLLPAWLATGALAHDFTVTKVRAAFDRAGRYQIDLTIDVDALTLGVSPATDSAELARRIKALSPEALQAAVQRARHTIGNRAKIEFDGRRARPQIEFPGPLPTDEPPGIPSVLGITARLTGEVPPGAAEFTFTGSRALNAVHLTITGPRGGPAIQHVLAAGESSPPFRLDEPPVPPSALRVVGEYLVLGFEHILPKGLDHILFVVGLFLLSTKLAPLLWQVSAFTLAHTVTLALSIYGVIALPASVVEPLIALSIAYVAVENMLVREMKPWRPAVVFGFGLLHGLGFAGVLRELGLPRGQFVTALIAFNVGVELGQLAVIAAALAAVGWARKRTWYRKRIVLPCSAVIGAVGLYWAVTRTISGA